jgi:hypothetical protein
MKKKRVYYPGAALKERRIENACRSLHDSGQVEFTADSVLDEMKRLSTGNDFTRQEVQTYLRKAKYLKVISYQLVYKMYSKNKVTTYSLKEKEQL